MAITTMASWIPTLDEFIDHWTLVNAEIGSAMVLQGGYTVAMFTADRDALETKLTAIVGLMNTWQMAGNTRDSTRSAMRERLRQFRAQVGALLPDTPYEAALPDLFGDGAGEGVLLEPLDDMAHLWGLIDADTTTAGFTAPLLLAGGYTLANSNVDLAGVRDAFKAIRQSVKNLEVERDRRDRMLEPLRERMGQYQKGVVANLVAGNALLDSVPVVSPPAGATPEAVTLSGNWDAGQSEAVFSWTESADPNLLRYALRMTPAANYDTGNDMLVANFQPGTLAGSTTLGLESSNLTATYRLYVMLTTGNEKGSNDITITRP